MGSPKYSLNKEDGKKIARGAFYAVGGALLTYIASTIPSVDFGQYTPIVVSISSIFISAATKFLTDTSKNA